MRLVKEINGLKPNFYVFTGEGSREYEILENLCDFYNDQNKVLWFPIKTIKKRSCKSAFKIIKDILFDWKINQFVCILDADCFGRDRGNEIRTSLQEIGMETTEITPIERGFLINCTDRGNEIRTSLQEIGMETTEITPIERGFLINCTDRCHNCIIYLIISGIYNCIEEEIIIFMKITLNIEYLLPENNNPDWRNSVKGFINNKLHEKGVTLKSLLKRASKNQLKESFPTICAILKKIESDC